MDSNKVLLSQDEIDVLIKFLASEKQKVNGEVLEQESVDKLLNLLKASNGTKLYFDSSLPKTKGNSGTAILVLDGEDNIGEQQQYCKLECEVNEQTGYIHVLCVNQKSGNRYDMKPNSLEQVRYINGDTSEWGFAIPPLTFDKMATLLQIKYTRATFDFVCEVFAKTLYGDKKHPIASMYMPLAHDLLQNMQI